MTGATKNGAGLKTAAVLFKPPVCVILTVYGQLYKTHEKGEK